MRLPRHLLMIGLLTLLAGCAGPRYEWGSYEPALYQHYRSPGEQAAFTSALAESLTRGEAKGKVPPGLYAEYGYQLYEAGRYDEAKAYFQKESAKWPESRVLMTRLIELCEQGRRKAGAL
mgnify:CR=1 FL=1